MNGVIIIDKPSGMTSQAVVSRVKRLFDVNKAGHGGTLDPMATGVLPVMLGNSVSASQYIASEDKHYFAGIEFGIETDTEDTTGSIIKEYPAREIALSDLQSACMKFVGDIMQTPPMYSALKVGGKKLVDLARKGIEIQREARKIKIYSITPCISDGKYYLDVHCGKGTYIRTLCADIGRALGTGAVMSSLRRTAAGKFDISHAVTLEQLEALTLAERCRLTIPNEQLLTMFPPYTLSEDEEKKFVLGALLPISLLTLPLSDAQIWRVYGKKGFIALGECINRDGNTYFKVKKFFM